MTSVRQAEMTARKRSTAAWADEQSEQRLSANLQLPPLLARAQAGTDAVTPPLPGHKRAISASRLPQTTTTAEAIEENNANLMVWGIGGRFESVPALTKVFSEFGNVKDANIRHRVDQDGKNTSWALLTMNAISEVDAALVAAEELAERFHLRVARFDPNRAAASSGAMLNRQEMNAKWKTYAEGPLSVRREEQRTRKFAQSGSSQAVLGDDAGIRRSSTLREVHTGGYLHNVLFNKSGSSVITAGDDRQVTIHDIRTGASSVLVERRISITVATIAPNGTLIAVGDDEGRLGVYSLANLGSSPHDLVQTSTRSRIPTEETPRSKLRRELTPATAGLELAWDPIDMHSTVVCAAFSLDSQLFAIVCEDGTIEVRDAMTGLGPRGSSNPGPMVLDFDGGASPEPGNCTLRFSADCLAVVGGSPSRHVQFWDVATLQKIRALHFRDQVLSIALRDDGVEAAVGFATGEVSVLKIGLQKYRVLRPLTVKQTSDVDSLAIGRLAVDDVVTCVESRPASEGSGINRLCIGDGWVSDYHNGIKVLERISGYTEIPTNALRRSRYCTRMCRPSKRQAGSTEVPTVHLRMEWCDRSLRETDRKVMSMAYSRPGHLLAMGKHCGTFLVYDTASWACVATYVHGSSRGMALSFSPASDQLALGGGHFQSAVIHQLKPPALLQRIGLGGAKILGRTLSGLENNITSGCVTFNYAAICTGSHVRLVNRHNLNDRILIATKVPVSAREEPIALRNGEVCQVAVVAAAKSVIVYGMKGELVCELPSPDETPWDGECRGVAWSLDGKWLFAWGMFGAKVYDANDGTYRFHFTDHKSTVRDCEIDPTGRFILMAGTSRCVTIFELHSEKPVHQFIESGITGPCTFDHAGDRFAYFDRGRGTKGGKVVMRDVHSGKIVRIYEGVKANAQIRFSPGDSEYLLCVDFQRHLTVLNTRDGLPDRVIWGGLLRSMALPPGNFCQWAVGWVPLQLASSEHKRTIWVGNLPEEVLHDQSNLRTALSVFGDVASITVRQKEGVQKSWALVSFDTAAAAQRAWSAGSIEITGPAGILSCETRQFSTEGDLHANGKLDRVTAMHHTHGLALYAGINSEMMIVDVEKFALSVTEDATFTADRLVALTDNAPDQIGVVSRRFPHCVNRRHDGDETEDLCTGDTVLHYCARKGKTEALSEWLYGEAAYEPVANSKGHTALHVAILSHNSKMVRQLFQQLTPNLNETSGRLLTGSLKLLAQEVPELVLEALQHIEVAALQELHQFRTYAHRHEVLGISTLAAPHPDLSSRHEQHASGAVKSTTASGEGDDLNSGRELWSELLPSTHKSAVEILMSSKVLCLTDFIGVPEDSPYHDIVERCEADVFESKLMRLATQFKWERNCSYQIRLQMMSYAACMILASCAMAASSLHGPRVQYQVVEDVAGDILAPQTIDVLQVAMVVVEIISILNEWVQMTREGFRIYFTLWNFIDLTSSCLLILGAAGHFTMTDVWYRNANGGVEAVRFGIWGEHIVRNAGSLGVLFKWLGFLDYLRSLESTTGPIMRMIHVIVKDMRSFITILLICMVGMVLFTVINMPWHDAYRYRAEPGSAGYLWPLVGMFRLMVFQDVADDTFSQSALATLIVTVFAFFVIILMMNLLIAIMGDSYEKVKEREYVEGVRERAITVVDMELRFPTMHEFPKYMLICEGVELDAKLHDPWSGIGGKIMQETSRTMARLTLLDNDLQSGLQNLNALVESNQEKLATAIEVLDDVEAKIRDLTTVNRSTVGGVVHQLERLAALHSEKELDDKEYALAKKAVLKTS